MGFFSSIGNFISQNISSAVHDTTNLIGTIGNSGIIGQLAPIATGLLTGGGGGDGSANAQSASGIGSTGGVGNLLSSVFGMLGGSVSGGGTSTTANNPLSQQQQQQQTNWLPIVGGVVGGGAILGLIVWIIKKVKR